MIVEQRVPDSTIGELSLVEFALPKYLFDFTGVVIDLLFIACHIDIVDMFGGQQILFDLKLLVVRCGLKSNLFCFFRSFNENALGASFVPVPGLMHCRQ